MNTVQFQCMNVKFMSFECIMSEDLRSNCVEVVEDKNAIHVVLG